MKKAPASFRERFRQLATDIGKSCYDMERYREFRMRPWQEAARYLCAFLGLLAVAVFVVFTASASRVPGQLAEHLRSALPDGTTLTVTDHQLSVTGAKGPLQVGTEAMPLVVDASIEGKEDPGKDALKDGVIAGRDAVFLREGGETINKQDYSTLENGAMTKEDILAFLAAYGSPSVVAAAALFTVFHLLFLVINAAWFVVFGAWLSYAVGKLWRVSLTYRQWVAIGLHAATLPILVDHLFWGFSLNVPFTFPFLYFMIMIAVILDERQAPVSKPTEAAA